MYIKILKKQESFDFSNYSTKSNYYDNLNKEVVDKTKDETAGVVIEEFVGLKANMYSHLVDDNSEHAKNVSAFGR